MSNELRALRLSKKLPARDMVAVVKEIYPKYDKTIQSKCERDDEYGVRIRDDALKALYLRFDPEQLQKIKKKKAGGHKLTCRISCRLPDETYEELQKYIQKDGYKTMQDWLSDTVEKYIRRKQRAEERRKND